MAEGRSNNGITEALRVSPSAVAKYVSNICTKLDLAPTDTDPRRVLAVLKFLGGWRHPPAPPVRYPSSSPGRRTLVLVSDNNFSAAQVTQFLAFAVGRDG